jgi:hypothetical protein
MAKVKGIIKLKGTFGGVNFYQLNGETIARQAGGGFTSEAIHTKNSMVRVRENFSEFKGCMQSVQFFKQGLHSFLSTFKDGTLHLRLVSLFTKLKDLDLVSARGSRTVYGGLQNPAGQELLQHYLLTSGSRLEILLHQKVLFDWTTGMSIPNFDAGKVSFPSGATHLGLQMGYLTYDFDKYTSSSHFSEMQYLTTKEIGAIHFTTPIQTETEGLKVAVVFARFVQEMNGQYYPLKNEKSVVLEVVALRQAQDDYQL